MQKIFQDDPHLKNMTPEGLKSMAIVERFVKAHLNDDSETRLQLLSDVITIDYSSHMGYPKKELSKEEAINYHQELRNKIEVIEYKISKVYADANTVFILGKKTERIQKSGLMFKEKCIWIYTIEADLIKKIECMKPCHPLYIFFIEIIERKKTSQKTL